MQDVLLLVSDWLAFVPRERERERESERESERERERERERESERARERSHTLRACVDSESVLLLCEGVRVYLPNGPCRWLTLTYRCVSGENRTVLDGEEFGLRTSTG